MREREDRLEECPWMREWREAMSSHSQVGRAGMDEMCPVSRWLGDLIQTSSGSWKLEVMMTEVRWEARNTKASLFDSQPISAEPNVRIVWESLRSIRGWWVEMLKAEGVC